MTACVYETIPGQPGESPTYFEIKQSMKDAALSHHPEIGKPIRRVVLGGIGVLTKTESAPPAAGGGCCCGPSGCGD